MNITHALIVLVLKVFSARARIKKRQPKELQVPLYCGSKSLVLSYKLPVRLSNHKFGTDIDECGYQFSKFKHA